MPPSPPRVSQEGTKYPLRIIKAVTTGGQPVVGVEATSRAEMEYFVRKLHEPPEEVQQQQLAARARAAADAAAAMYGAPSGSGGGGAYADPSGHMVFAGKPSKKKHAHARHFR